MRGYFERVFRCGSVGCMGFAMSDVERLHWWLLLMSAAAKLHDRGYGQLAKDLRAVAMSAFSKSETWSQTTGEQR